SKSRATTLHSSSAAASQAPTRRSSSARSDRMHAADPAAGEATRCGIDTVEIARIERLLAEAAPDELTSIFSAQEIRDSGEGPGRAASLAARFAAKEACAKLFPRELARGLIGPADVSVARDAYGAPQITCTPRAQAVLDQQRICSITVSLTHDRVSASAVTLALPAQAHAPFASKPPYHLLPFRPPLTPPTLPPPYA